jgi:hypothetical protein
MSRHQARFVARASRLFAVLLLCATCEPGQDLQTDFCAALQQDDRPTLRDAVDQYLDGLPPGEPLAVRMERLRLWIAGQPCVATAELDPVLADTEPPVQQVRVQLAGDPAVSRMLGIVLDASRPRFNLR